MEVGLLTSALFFGMAPSPPESGCHPPLLRQDEPLNDAGPLTDAAPTTTTNRNLSQVTLIISATAGDCFKMPPRGKKRQVGLGPGPARTRVYPHL